KSFSRSSRSNPPQNSRRISSPTTLRSVATSDGCRCLSPFLSNPPSQSSSLLFQRVRFFSSQILQTVPILSSDSFLFQLDGFKPSTRNQHQAAEEIALASCWVDFWRRR